MALAPVGRSERLALLDVARGIAVLGVLVMNIWAFAGPQAFFDYPRALAGRPGEPVLTWIVVHTLFEGSQRTLLSLLFGAGALLALRRFEQRAGTAGARRTWYRRTFVLIGFGLVNAYLFMWPADILFVYGLAGLCLYPLRHRRDATLVAVVLVAVAVPVGLRLAEISSLRAQEAAATAAGADQQAIDAWQAQLREARPSPDDAKIAGDIAVMQSGTFTAIARRQAGVSIILQTIVTAKWWFLDALGMMVVGMLLCRRGLFTTPQPRSVQAGLVAGGFGIGLPLAAWQTYTLLATDFHPVAATNAQLGYDLRRLAMTLGYLGLVIGFCQAARGAAVKRSLAAVGRMALTNYLAQSVICGLVFYGFGLGLYGRLTGYQLYGVVAAVWALQIAWSRAWLARFQIGPCEWLWRSLTYGRRQPWHDRPPTTSPRTPEMSA